MANFPHSSTHKLRKLIERRTVYPLTCGLVLASAVAIILLWTQEYKWVKNVKDYLVDEEDSHLLRASVARSMIFTAMFSNDIAQLQLVRGIFDDSASGAITSASGISDPKAVDARNPGSITFPAYGLSDYLFADTTRTLASATNYEQLKLLDILYNTANPIYAGRINQVGLIIEKDSLDFRHPAQNMSYVQGSSFDFTETCGKSNVAFDPLCTNTYHTLKSNSKNNVTFSYEYSLIDIYLNTDFGATAIFTDKNVLKFFMNDFEYYTYFLTSNYGSQVLAVNKEDLSQIFPYNLSYNLFPDDYILANVSAPKLQSMIDEKTTSGSVFDGLNSRYHVSVTNMNITITTQRYPSYEDSLSVGVMISEIAVRKEWNDTLDTITNTIIIQMVIFMCFILLTIFSAVRLSKHVSHRVTHPLQELERYLNGDEKMIYTHIKYNREVNTIVKSLNLIEDIEKLIDPHYLLHPKSEDRLKNLEEVREIYRGLGNLRGVAITSNLIGNIFFENSQYLEAIQNYTYALEITEKILENIENQEKEELKLSEKEKIKDGFISSDWKSEKEFLVKDINNRRMQLCMARRAKLEEGLASATELRTEWKEILSLQTSVLQHYIDTSSNFLQLIQLLIEMSISFQFLQYFHSAMEILNIVNDELTKIEQRGLEFIDIDIALLKRIGIGLRENQAAMLSFFNVKGITYEKDILRQFMYYRKGVICIEQNKFQEAGAAFTLAIERGEYYDPKIRKLCVEELLRIMNKFSIKKGTDDLKRMDLSLNQAKKSIVFVLNYKVKNKPKLNKKLIKFVNKEIGPTRDKFGVVCMNTNNYNILDVCTRDMPEVDLEHLLFQAKHGESETEEVMYHIYNMIMCGFKCMPVDMLEKYIIVFIGPHEQERGPIQIKDLDEVIARKVKLIVVCVETHLEGEFKEFLDRNNCRVFMCEKMSEVNDVLEEVRDLIYEKCLI
ncbi:unnamed protein product [Blepharisma stoltei]|uniref:Uncharacterized protein n=1 Tax=Blepharisma stoltei TaxID=1481888 RepID=A0AAU9JWJ9_9CILI|nr:unnamed protein product [Blepharisma stoltei]